MKILRLFFWSIFCLCLISCADAADNSIPEPADDKQRLLINNLNLKGTDFWAAYMSKDVKQRRFAEMYLTGVLDSTEGDKWCGYELALPGSIQEQIYIGFKNLSLSAMSHRASEIILSILSDKLPCKRHK